MSHQRSRCAPRSVAVLLALALAACSQLPVKSPHLNIDADGYAADERGRAFQKPASQVAPTEEQREVAEVLAAASAELAKYCSNGQGRGHIMLFVHGGMVSTRAAMKSSRELDSSGVFADRGIVPIYINWNSSLFSALADDILWVRAGNRAPEGVVVAPIVALTRLVAGLFEAPPNLFYQLQDESRFFQSWEYEDRSLGQQAMDGAVGLVHAPFTIASVPLFTGFGRGSWSMMKRRIDVMYSVQKAPNRFFYRKKDKQPGVMRTFLVELAKQRQQWEDDCAEFELDFFGHSMGALVGTRMLREFGYIDFDRVIYAAAAASAEDFITTLPVYLAQHGSSEFFSYSLSIVDEGNELSLMSALFPRGSLLVWVDNFFDPLLSPEDYRLGDFWNKPVFLVPTDTRTNGICDRMTFVKFVDDFPDGTPRPRGHGEFNDPEVLEGLLGLSLDGRQAIDDCPGCVRYDVCSGSYPAASGTP